MIRSDHRFEGLRVVLVCAQVPPPDAAALGEAGVDATLTAPVMPSALFDAMADVVGSALVAPPPARSATAPADPDGHLGLVLVVEDNEVNQLVAQGVLESLGYSVVLARNGVDGVAAHHEHADALVAVLMDCQMPLMDGYEATRAIRAQEEPGHRLPVVAMTASAIAGERERCLRAGMDDFLTKPIDVALLASTLQRWTGSGLRLPSRDGVEEPAANAANAAGAAGADARVDVPSDGAAVLDPARLEELRELEPGDPSLLLRFIDRFGEGSRHRIGELREAHSAGDADAQGRIAHGLKGSAANLGAVLLADVCKQVEDLGAAGRLADEALVARVEDEVDRATRALEGYAARLRQVVLAPPEA
jgi:CheY-like chemotaxis protein/HPt (histidine-containing phosphotransfer) domain-containing protein